MFAASKSGQVTGSTPPPPTPTNDPQFSLVTALITGDGTNGSQNNTFIDSSPNNFTITRAGNTTQGSASPYGGNWSNYFDGSSYLTVPAGTAFAPLTGDFTVEGWINPSGLMSGYGMIYGQTYSGANYFTIFATDGTVKFINPSGTWSSGANLWTVGSWNHFAVVRNGGSTRVYLNGVGGTAAADAYNYTEVTVLPTIGRYTHTGSNFYFGYISNLRYVKGTAVYTANFTPSTTPLTAITNTSLLTCQSPRFVDNSFNNFTVTNNGNTSTQVFSPFEPATLTPISYSGYFDGTGDYLSLATNAAFNITSGSTDSFICEFWVKFSSVAANTSLVDNGGLSGATLSNWNIQLNASQQFGIVWGNEGAQQGILASSTVPTTGQWYHIALVKTNADWALFINGARGISYNGINTASKSSATALYIGYGITTSAGGNGLNGVVSNVRIYKGATASAPYLATSTTITVPTSPLTAITNTSLLTCQSNTFVDNSPNNFAITSFGDAKTAIQNPFGTTSALTTGYSTSVASGSVAFNGSTSYLLLPVTTALAFPADYTLEAWVYLNSVSGSQYVYSSIDNGSDAWQGIVLGFVGTSFVATSYVSGADTITHQTAVAAGQWYHVAMVRSGSTTKSYLNGVQSTSTTTSSYSLTQSGSTIGAAYAGTSLLNGCISNLRIVKGTALYTSSFTPTFTPLTAISGTQLLTCQSSTSITDASSNGFTVTSVGTPVTTVANPFGITSVNGASIFLDGTGDYLTVPANSSVTAFGTGDFTVETWLYATVYPHLNGMFLFDARTSGNPNNWCLYLGSGDSLIWVYNGGAIATYAGYLYQNRWYHIAYSRTGTTGRLFVNGVALATVTDASNYSQTTVLTVGGRYTQDYAVQGYMSNVRIIKGQALYKSNFVPPVAPVTVVSNTSLLLNGTNGGIIDNAMMNDYETGGNAQISTAVVKYGTGSLYFDGTGDYLKAPFQPQYSLSGDFTVEAWVYLTTNTHTGNLTIASLGYNNSTGTGPWGFYLNGSGPYTLYFNTSGTNHASTTTATFTLNTWIHVTYCRSGSSGRFFVNGNIVGTAVTDTSTYTGTTESLFVGIMSDGASAPFVGYMDDFRITKYARYVANFTPPTQAFPIY
jgi:hypothetical protein